MMWDKTLLLTFVLLLSAVLLAACSSGSGSPVPLPGEDGDSGSDPVVLTLGGVVTGAPDLTPMAGMTVELIRIDSEGNVLEILASTLTDENGVYIFEDPPDLTDGSFAVRVLDGNGAPLMHALVSGELVDINPFSEYVYQSVLQFTVGTIGLDNFLNQEIAALYALLISMDIDVKGLSLADVLELIEESGGSLYMDILASFALEGAETMLRGNNYGVTQFSSRMRDPSVLGSGEGGIEIAGTQAGFGRLQFGSDSDLSSSNSLMSIGRHLHDLESVRDLVQQESGLSSETIDYSGLLHVVSAKGQLIVAASDALGTTVAGAGAVSGDGSLMVYPLDTRTRDGSDNLAASSKGLRFATRWPAIPDDGAQDNTLLDPNNGGTPYNFVQLEHRLVADGSENNVGIEIRTGSLSFDSTDPVFVDSGGPGQSEYGHLQYSPSNRNALTLGIDDHVLVGPNTGVSSVQEWLYLVFANTGGVQLRNAANEEVLGFGSTTPDGEILGFSLTTFGSEVVPEAERVQMFAVRQPATDPVISGIYNLVEYTLLFGEEDDTGTVDAAYRYGAVKLDAGSIGAVEGSSDGSFAKRVGLDLAAAQSETEPSLSLRSGLASLSGTGSYHFTPDGVVTLNSLEWSGAGLTTSLSGNGAVNEDGSFIVIATEVADDNGVQGRGLLLLMRQSD